MNNRPAQESQAFINTAKIALGLFFVGCAAAGSRYLSRRKTRIKKLKSSLDKLHRVKDLHDVDEEKYNQLLAECEREEHNLRDLQVQFNELKGANLLTGDNQLTVATQTTASKSTKITISHSPTLFAAAGASSSIAIPAAQISLPISSDKGKRPSIEKKLVGKLSNGLKQFENDQQDLQRRYEELLERMRLVCTAQQDLTNEIELYLKNKNNSSLAGGR